MAIVYRSVKGSNLTPSEIDGNFSDLDGRVVNLETNPPSPDELVSVTLSGSDLSFNLLSGNVLGPVTVNLPRFRDRGGFIGSMVLAVNDIFTVDGIGLVLALVDHTAAVTFDENAEATPATTAGSFIPGRWYIIDTIGTTDFTLIGAVSNTVGLAFRATGVGSGTGTASLKLYDVMVRTVDLTTIVFDDLTDVSVASPGNNDFVVYDAGSSPPIWSNRTPTQVTALLDVVVGPSGSPLVAGTKGLVPAPGTGDLGKVLDASGNWVVPENPVLSRSSTGSPLQYTLVIGDSGSYLRISNATASSIVIPAEVSVDFDIGATVSVEQTGAGEITIDGAFGVTVNVAGSHTPVTNGQWAVVQVKKVGVDEWTLFGNLVPV